MPHLLTFRRGGATLSLEMGMPLVKVFEGKDAKQPLFTAEFAFLPRLGEYITREAGGFFQYYDVVEVWHRQESEAGAFPACVRVELDD